MRQGVRKILTPLLLASLPVAAEIRYIPLEEAESKRKCLLFTNRLNESEEELRKATVAGGSVLGKTTVETNAIRTKLKFERDYYRRKSAEACAEEAEREAEAEAEAAGDSAEEQSPDADSRLAQDAAEEPATP